MGKERKSKLVLLTYLLTTFSVILLLTLSTPVVDAEINSNWQYLRTYTINSSLIDEELTNFPILVYLNSNRIDWANVQDDLDDLRFTPGTDFDIELPYEIENYTINVNATIWVQIPLISNTSDTTFSVYYGNPDASSGENSTGVWDINYIAVYHVKENAGTSLNDSTRYVNNATITGATFNSSGMFGNSLQFDGTNDYWNATDIPQLENTSGTVEAWVSAPSGGAPATSSIIIQKHNSVPHPTDTGEEVGFRLNYYDDPNSWWYWIVTNGSCPGQMNQSAKYADFPPSPNYTWRYIAGVVTGDKFGDPVNSTNIYINGINESDRDNGMPEIVGHISAYDGSDLLSGVDDKLNGDFLGTMDEWRISNISRSETWLNATYFSGIDVLISSWGTEGEPFLASITWGALYQNITGTYSLVSEITSNLSTFDITPGYPVRFNATINVSKLIGSAENASDLCKIRLIVSAYGTDHVDDWMTNDSVTDTGSNWTLGLYHIWDSPVIYATYNIVYSLQINTTTTLRYTADWNFRIFEFLPNNAYDDEIIMAWTNATGGGGDMLMRSTIRFHIDASDLPNGLSTVINGTSQLFLYYYDRFDDPVGKNISIDHQWWRNGTGPSVSTWNNYDGVNAWTAPGGDYHSEHEVNATVPASYGWVVWNVTEWINHQLNLWDGVETTAYIDFFLKFGNETSVADYRFNCYGTGNAVGDEYDPYLTFPIVGFSEVESWIFWLTSEDTPDTSYIDHIYVYQDLDGTWELRSDTRENRTILNSLYNASTRFNVTVMVDKTIASSTAEAMSKASVYLKVYVGPNTTGTYYINDWMIETSADDSGSYYSLHTYLIWDTSPHPQEGVSYNIDVELWTDSVVTYTFYPEWCSSMDNHTKYGTNLISTAWAATSEGTGWEGRTIIRFDIPATTIPFTTELDGTNTLELQYFDRRIDDPAGEVINVEYVWYREGMDLGQISWMMYDVSESALWIDPGSDYITLHEAQETVPPGFGEMEWNVTDWANWILEYYEGSEFTSSYFDFLLIFDDENQIADYDVYWETEDNETYAPTLTLRYEHMHRHEMMDLQLNYRTITTLDIQKFALFGGLGCIILPLIFLAIRREDLDVRNVLMCGMMMVVGLGLLLVVAYI